MLRRKTVSQKNQDKIFRLASMREHKARSSTNTVEDIRKSLQETNSRLGEEGIDRVINDVLSGNLTEDERQALMNRGQRIFQGISSVLRWVMGEAQYIVDEYRGPSIIAGILVAGVTLSYLDDGPTRVEMAQGLYDNDSIPAEVKQDSLQRLYFRHVGAHVKRNEEVNQRIAYEFSSWLVDENIPYGQAFTISEYFDSNSRRSTPVRERMESTKRYIEALRDRGMSLDSGYEYLVRARSLTVHKVHDDSLATLAISILPPKQ